MANFFISPTGSGSGDGSTAGNAANASTASLFTSIINNHGTSGTTIVYAAGTYPAVPTLHAYSGLTHQGAGIDQTFLRVPNGAVATGANAGSWLWSGQVSPIVGFKVFDMTIDFNGSNQPAFQNGLDYCSVGFGLRTPNNCTIQRVKFISLSSQNFETFVIYFADGGANGNCFNNLIDSCIFTQPVATNNINSGMTIIYLGDWLPNITVDNTNIVNNCQFTNINYPTYSDLHYVTCVTGPVVTNCTATSVDGLWGCEPGSQGGSNNGTMYVNQTCQVTGNTLTNVGRVGGILLHPDSAGAFGSVNIQNNTMLLAQHPYQFFNAGGGPEFCTIATTGGGGTSAVGTWTVQNNTVTAPSPPWGANPVLFIGNQTNGVMYHAASLQFLNNNMIGFPGTISNTPTSSYLNINLSEASSITVSGNTFGATTGVPSLGVASATNINLTTATLNGSITATNGSAISSDGFEWGPTTQYLNGFIAATTVQTGNFSVGLTGLTNGQNYHFRARATNTSGQGFSADANFTAGPPPPFRQGNLVVGGQTGAVLTTSVTYLQAQTNANSNVVAISFNSTTASIAASNGVIDTKGNVYQVASPLTRSATDSQVIYWCPSIISDNVAGSNSVTVTLTVASGFISVRAAEYNGLGGIDQHKEGTGVGTTASIPAMTTTNANDIIIAAANCGTLVSGAAPGFVDRMNAQPQFGSDFQDEKPGAIVTNITIPTPLSSSTNWIENAVAFFPAGVVNTIPTINTTAATNVLANTATLNGTIVSTGNQTITADGFDYGTTTAYGTHVVATTVQSGAFSAPISGLTSGTLYHFTATAQNSIGSAVPVDNTFQFIPPPLTVPGAFTANPTSTSSITLNWTVSTGGTGAIHYEVWHHAPGAGFTLAITTGAAAITANDTGLASGTLYSYQIRAVDSVTAQSAFSSQIDAPTYASLPGNFYASNYNVGGQNVGYFDNQGANIGVGRSDGVDLKATSDAPAGSGFVLGFRAAAEWTKYNVNVASTGTYTVAVRYESQFATGQFHIVDVTTSTTIIASVILPATGPFDTLSSWVTTTLGNVSLTSGNHVLQVLIDNQFLDFNYFSFTSSFPPSWLAQVLALKSATPSSGFVIIGSGIQSLESLGLIHILQPQSTLLSGIGSLQAFGAPSVNGSGNVSIAEAPWIFDGVMGTPSFAEGIATISGAGIASAQSFGFASFSFSTVPLSLSGIGSLQALGNPTFQEGNAFLFISSVPDSSAIGSMTLFQPGAQFIPQPVILTVETFGSLTVVQALQINLQSIPSVQSLGTPTINRGDVPISLVAIDSQEVFGLGHVAPFGNADIFLAPTLTGESFGIPSLSGSGNVNLSMAGISSAEVVNNPQVTQAGAPPIIVMRSINTLESLGVIHTLLGIATINLSGIPSVSQFGIPTIYFPGGPTHMGRVL